jgi:hypothetical protein
MFDFLSRLRSRILLAVQVTGTGTQAYLAPTGGVKSIILRCLVTMGNSADLVLSLKYADDAGGTNATAFAAVSPINVDGAAVTAAKTYTVSASTGNFIVDFIVDPALVPEGKFVGLSYANSHNSSLLAVEMLEDPAYIPTVA